MLQTLHEKVAQGLRRRLITSFAQAPSIGAESVESRFFERIGVEQCFQRRDRNRVGPRSASKGAARAGPLRTVEFLIFHQVGEQTQRFVARSRAECVYESP